MGLKTVVLVKVSLMVLLLGCCSATITVDARRFDPITSLITRWVKNGGDDVNCYYGVKPETSGDCCNTCSCYYGVKPETSGDFCNTCNCAQSDPPQCLCADEARRCHSDCQQCICTSVYPPVCYCADVSNSCNLLGKLIT